MAAKDNEDISSAAIYANAIYQMAVKNNILDEIIKESEIVLAEVLNVSKFIIVLNSSNVGIYEKHNIIVEIFDGKFSKLIENIFHVVVDANRTNIIETIFCKFLSLVDEKKGIVGARIYSVVELKPTEKKKLKEQLEKYFQKNFRIKYILDPAIIGGVLFRSGDISIDCTVRGELSKIKGRLENIEIFKNLKQVG